MIATTSHPGPSALARRREVLLAMLSSVVEPDAVAMSRFSEEDWDAIALMARQHRLEPLLHAQLRQRGDSWPVPESLRARLKERHKQATVRAMTCQQALRRTAGLLADAGIPFAVLKGGWLAWSAYPEAARRVLRDIDFLIPGGQAVAAFTALEAAGYTRKARDVTPVEHALQHDKHLPPLFTPQGSVAVELHTRIIHDLPAGNLAGTIGDSYALLARAQPRDLGGFTVPCLSPTDTLLHLMVHAAHDHQFDNGPLVLNDIAELVRTCPVDWDLLQGMAAAGGWQRGSAVLLRLALRYHGALPVPEHMLAPAADDQDVLDAAAQLMLVDHRSAVDTRFRAELAAESTLRDRLGFLRQRAFPQRHTLAAYAGLPLKSPWVWLHYPLWLVDRSRRRLLSDGGPGEDEDRRHLQTVNEWLRA